jgi:hypothetical protein
MMTCIFQFCYCKFFEDNSYRLPCLIIIQPFSFFQPQFDDCVADIEHRYLAQLDRDERLHTR